MPPGMGAAVLHLLGCMCVLPKLPVHPPIPYPSAFLSLSSSSCRTHKLGSHPLPQTPKTEFQFQHHAALAPTAPPWGSAWTIISLLSYHTLTDEGPSTIFPFLIRTQQCCGVLNQQLRGQQRKHSSSQPCFSVRSYRSYRATPLHQSCCFMLCGAVRSSDWL